MRLGHFANVNEKARISGIRLDIYNSRRVKSYTNVFIFVTLLFHVADKLDSRNVKIDHRDKNIRLCEDDVSQKN